MENFRCISIICDLCPSEASEIHDVVMWKEVNGFETSNLTEYLCVRIRFICWIDSNVSCFYRVLELDLQNATFPELSASMVSVATFHKM